MESNELREGIGAIREEYFRSGGKGGQNVNKVESGVRLRAAVEDPELLEKLREKFPGYLNAAGEILVSSTRERDREPNRRRAYARLDEILAEARAVPRERVATKPKRAAKERRLETKRRRGETKQLRGRVRDW